MPCFKQEPDIAREGRHTEMYARSKRNGMQAKVERFEYLILNSWIVLTVIRLNCVRKRLAFSSVL